MNSTSNSKTYLPAILIIEDDVINASVIKKFLQSDYDISVANNADIGIEMASSKDYSLILLDINLGRGINGVEVLKIIREMPKYLSVPIIASTAYTMKGDKEKLLSAGFTDYISKPFSMDEIRKKVKEHIKM
jgi:CheY-like chemotaxis protein